MQQVDNKTFSKWISDVSKNFLDTSVLTSATRASIFKVLGELSKDEADYVAAEKIAEKLGYTSTHGLSSTLLLASAYKITNFKVERIEEKEGLKRLYQFSRGDHFELFGSEGTRLHKISLFIVSQDFIDLPTSIRKGDFEANPQLGEYFLEGAKKVAAYFKRSIRSDAVAVEDTNGEDTFTLTAEEFFELMFWTGTISSRVQRDALSFFGIPHFYYGRISGEEQRSDPKSDVTRQKLIQWIATADASQICDDGGDGGNEYVRRMIDILEWGRWLKREVRRVEGDEGREEEIYMVGNEMLKIENCPKTFGEDQDSIVDAYHRFWKEFERSVATGKAGVFFRYGVDSFFDYLKTQPSLLEEYHQRTRTGSEFFASHAISYDYSHNDVVVEVGGSLGYFILALLAKYPSLKGVVFDLPEVVENAKSQLHLVDAEVASRCQFVGGSFFDHVPPVDTPNAVFFLKNILHDWSHDEQIRILKCVAAAMRNSPNSSLQIIEVFFDEENILEAARYDLHTLLCWGVPLLTYYDYRCILREADFAVTEEGHIFPAICYVNATLTNSE